MDVVAKVCVGHHKDGDISQAEQNILISIWVMMIDEVMPAGGHAPADICELCQFVLHCSRINSNPEDCLSNKRLTRTCNTTIVK